MRRVDDDNHSPFGLQLRRLRLAAGLSQEELAERAGLTGQAVGALERGARQRPYPETVRRLADALGLSDEERAAFSRATSERSEPPEGTGAHEPPPTTSLPLPLTSLIGREADLATVTTLLGGGTRLVTLVGPGGVGKTRLAIAVAGHDAIGRHFPDGVAFVALAPLAEATHVLPAIANVLGLRMAGDQPLREMFKVSLRARRLLLVLDNCEHVLEAAPEIADLLAACPDIAVLATSRAPLHVRGEQEYPVAPLALPELARVPNPDEVAQASAVQLFLERARAVSPGFGLTRENATAVAAICRRLDGLPLALELAAARIKLLPPVTLLARLDRALPLLVGGARDLPARQRTIRDTVAWSYSLLDDAERLLFRRLAVFAGGCTLEAAEAVCGTPTLPAFDVLELLGSLVDKNLLYVQEEAGGEARFGMLAIIREYAVELLASSGEDAATRGRHARYFQAMSETLAPRLTGPDQGRWLDRLEREQDNLRAALRWLLAGYDVEGSARLAIGRLHFWHYRGDIAEGRAWLEQTLAAGQDLAVTVRIPLLVSAGLIAWQQVDYAGATVHFEEALALARAHGVTQGINDALISLGIVAHFEGNIPRARALLGEALAAQRQGENQAALSWTLFHLGLTTISDRSYDEAIIVLEEAVSCAQSAGVTTIEAVAQIALGLIALHRGLPEEAAPLWRQGLSRVHAYGLKHPTAFGLEVATVAAVQRGAHVRAGRLWGARAALHEQLNVALTASEQAQYGPYVDRAHAQLGEDGWATALTEGRAMSLDEAVAYALTDGST